MKSMKKENEVSNYTKDEVEKFDKRDLRISKSGLIQALIQSGLFTKEEIVDGTVIKDITEMYRRWIWDETPLTEAKIEVPCDKGMINWVELAKTNSLIVPTCIEENILMKLLSVYKDDGYEIDPSKLMAGILTAFKKYPNKESSIAVVMSKIPVESLLTT